MHLFNLLIYGLFSKCIYFCEILNCIELYAESFPELVIGLWLFEALRDNLKLEPFLERNLKKACMT